MQPLSLHTRRWYFYSLITVFVIVVPFLILFALGYRFDDRLGLISTGGLYIAADVSGVEIYLDGVGVRETGTFRRAFFIQNIEPGLVTVRTEREGYHTWQKELEIAPHIVTEAATFMLPTEPVTRPIPQYREVTIETATTTATTTVINGEYLSVLDLFGFTATTSTDVAIGSAAPLIVTEQQEESAESTFNIPFLTIEPEATTTIERRGVVLAEAGDGMIVVTWQRNIEDTPYFFCSVRGSCVDEVLIDTNELPVTYFDFLPDRNDVVLLARTDGIFATEVDPRGGQNTQPLFEGTRTTFRIDNTGAVFIKQDNTLFEVAI